VAIGVARVVARDNLSNSRTDHSDHRKINFGSHKRIYKVYNTIHPAVKLVFTLATLVSVVIPAVTYGQTPGHTLVIPWPALVSTGFNELIKNK